MYFLERSVSLLFGFLKNVWNLGYEPNTVQGPLRDSKSNDGMCAMKKSDQVTCFACPKSNMSWCYNRGPASWILNPVNEG